MLQDLLGSQAGLRTPKPRRPDRCRPSHVRRTTRDFARSHTQQRTHNAPHCTTPAQLSHKPSHHHWRSHARAHPALDTLIRTSLALEHTRSHPRRLQHTWRTTLAFTENTRTTHSSNRLVARTARPSLALYFVEGDERDKQRRGRTARERRVWERRKTAEEWRTLREKKGRMTAKGGERGV